MRSACRIGCLVLMPCILLVAGCPTLVPGDTPSIGTPAPCNSDEDCPDGITCVLPDGGEEPGFCDVDETQEP